MHSLFRVGKKSTKFDFELSSVEAIHSAIEGKLVTLRWVRGSKSGGTHKNVLSTPDGRAIWSAADTMALGVTLYRSDAAGAFDAKEYRIAVDEVVRAGATKTLASAKIDLAKFADEMCASKDAECELTLVGDDGLKGRIKLHLACALPGALTTRSTPKLEQTKAVRDTAEFSRAKEQIQHEKGKKVKKGAEASPVKAGGSSEKGGGKLKMPAWERRALGLPSDRLGFFDPSAASPLPAFICVRV